MPFQNERKKKLPKQYSLHCLRQDNFFNTFHHYGDRQTFHKAVQGEHETGKIKNAKIKS